MLPEADPVEPNANCLTRFDILEAVEPILERLSAGCGQIIGYRIRERFHSE
jgi:DNA-binding IclR family transcriptional regulator